jgi:hypothetical protein
LNALSGDCTILQVSVSLNEKSLASQAAYVGSIPITRSKHLRKSEKQSFAIYPLFSIASSLPADVSHRDILRPPSTFAGFAAKLRNWFQ